MGRLGRKSWNFVISSQFQVLYTENSYLFSMRMVLDPRATGFLIPGRYWCGNQTRALYTPQTTSPLVSCMVGNSEALGSFWSELQSLSWEDLAESLGTLSLKLIITISSTLHWKQLSFYPWEWSLFLNPRTPGFLIPGLGVRIWDWSICSLGSRARPGIEFFTLANQKQLSGLLDDLRTRPGIVKSDPFWYIF